MLSYNYNLRKSCIGFIFRQYSDYINEIIYIYIYIYIGNSKLYILHTYFRHYFGETFIKTEIISIWNCC